MRTVLLCVVAALLLLLLVGSASAQQPQEEEENPNADANDNSPTTDSGSEDSTDDDSFDDDWLLEAGEGADDADGSGYGDSYPSGADDFEDEAEAEGVWPFEDAGDFEGDFEGDVGDEADIEPEDLEAFEGLDDPAGIFEGEDDAMFDEEFEDGGFEDSEEFEDFEEFEDYDEFEDYEALIESEFDFEEEFEYEDAFPSSSLFDGDSEESADDYLLDDVGSGFDTWSDFEELEPVEMRQAPPASANASASTELEYDDASVDEGSIPSGYFQQRPQVPGGNRGRKLDPGSIRFPGFQLFISPGYSGRAWWEYNRNVCVTKKELKRKRRSRGSRALFSQCSVKCREVNTTHYACRVKQTNGRGVKSVELMYTCCAGFTRLAGDRGCPRHVDPNRSRTFAELLSQLGYNSSHASLLNATMGRSRSSRGLTVFVPKKEALAEFVDSWMTVSNDTRSRRQFVQSALNLFSPGARHSSSFAAGERLSTRAAAGSGGILLSSAGDTRLANCQPVLRPDLPFRNFSFVHVTERVLPLPNATVYEAMLRVMVARWRIQNSRARKILSPLRNVLSRRTVTVFMHRPSEMELQTGCYTKNIRSAALPGVFCSQSLLQSERRSLKSIEGKSISVWAADNVTVMLGQNASVTEQNIVASNGILHLVNDSVIPPIFINAAYWRLRSSPEFNSSLFSPNASGVTFLIPRGRSYAEDADWLHNATALREFGRRHLAKGGFGRGGWLTMLDGSRRRMQAVLALTTAGTRKSFFVDCVRVASSARNCDGSVFHLLNSPLPDFNSTKNITQFLLSNANYSITVRLMQYMSENVARFDRLLRARDVTITVLPDSDLRRLIGGSISISSSRSRSMRRVAAWYLRNFVRSKRQCPVQRGSDTAVVALSRRRCRSLFCALLTARRRAAVRVSNSMYPVYEGFVLKARIVE